MREASLVTQILKYINSIPGCKAEKRHGSQYSEAGAPDISACCKGRRVELEVKRPGEKPTRIQLRRLVQWQEAGAISAWVTTMEEVKFIIEGALKNVQEKEV